MQKGNVFNFCILHYPASFFVSVGEFHSLLGISAMSQCEMLDLEYFDGGTIIATLCNYQLSTDSDSDRVWCS